MTSPAGQNPATCSGSTVPPDESSNGIAETLTDRGSPTHEPTTQTRQIAATASYANYLHMLLYCVDARLFNRTNSASGQHGKHAKKILHPDTTEIT